MRKTMFKGQVRRFIDTRDDIVVIPRKDIYAKSQEALDAFLGVLRKNGYKVEDWRERYGSWKIDAPKEKYWSFFIREAWHWMPLERSPKLHDRILAAAGMRSDTGGFYQDGRVAFYDFTLERMHIFVQHFTVLDINDWDRLIARTPKSGPEMVRAIAHFCSDEPEIDEGSNVFNALYGIAKVVEGRSLSTKEQDAMDKALRDDGIRDDLKSLLSPEKQEEE